MDQKLVCEFCRKKERERGRLMDTCEEREAHKHMQLLRQKGREREKKKCASISLRNQTQLPY